MTLYFFYQKTCVEDWKMRRLSHVAAELAGEYGGKEDLEINTAFGLAKDEENVRRKKDIQVTSLRGSQVKNESRF